MKQSDIQTILTTLSIDVQPFNIILWLRHFIPSIMHNTPSHMKYIVGWCINQTYALKSSGMWPEIGLEFIKNIYDIFNDIKFCFA